MMMMMTRFSRSLLESLLVAVILFRHVLVLPQVIDDDNMLCLQGIKTSLQYNQKENEKKINPLYSLSSWVFINNSYGSSICSFPGVSCYNDQETHIIGINLDSWALKGQIPQSLKYCRRLMTLSVSNNYLIGSIPSQICTWLPNLATLDLSMNFLSGSIPWGLANCSSLNNLQLSMNMLSGNIPSELFTLATLEQVVLANNNLSGQIPEFVQHLQSLKMLDLSYNMLSGVIPSQICKWLPNLETLDLSMNALSGQIPGGLANCSFLKSLLLSVNYLSGYIPSELFTIVTLIRLSLESNNLRGEIPQFSVYLHSFDSLNLQKNYLSGVIPSQLCTWLPNLVTLKLSRNKLSGSIPPTLAKCSSLRNLWLSKNSLYGSIPQLPKLDQCYLAFNNLSGRIPPSLSYLDLNSFSGNTALCGHPLGTCGWLTRKKILIIVGFGVFAASILLGMWWFKFKAAEEEGIYDIRENGESIDQVPGMPSRFSYHDIQCLTGNFSKKLGQGGFGSVFEGTLTTADGKRVAVKCLDGVGHIKDSFFAEVNTIGSIHHVNLVRLLGFCTEKSHQLLVYEYMPNGSLEKWIFNRAEVSLTWTQRKKIILDVAKGLNYLHIECHHKILHLDIKPQNILLDENFNAKLGDFGLSKLIDKEQSRVATSMRGTPGYLAPEWLHGVITEKVDVYSFGVVILEIVCGRKLFDVSQSEEDMYLLSLLTRKMEENKLLDIFFSSPSHEEMQLYGVEAENMMKLAAWCLQSSYTKRPSMSMVVKVLEGALEVEADLDYNFWYKQAKEAHTIILTHETPLLASVLSGPR